MTQDFGYPHAEKYVRRKHNHLDVAGDLAVLSQRGECVDDIEGAILRRKTVCEVALDQWNNRRGANVFNEPENAPCRLAAWVTPIRILFASSQTGGNEALEYAAFYLILCTAINTRSSKEEKENLARVTRFTHLQPTNEPTKRSAVDMVKIQWRAMCAPPPLIPVRPKDAIDLLGDRIGAKRESSALS